MKLSISNSYCVCCNVAPFAGAWIEIVEIIDEYSEKAVAPFAGARIEKNNELLRNHKQRVEVPFL